MTQGVIIDHLMLKWHRYLVPQKLQMIKIDVYQNSQRNIIPDRGKTERLHTKKIGDYGNMDAQG